MSAQKLIKINNSYESEPSSCSSTGGPPEYNAEYDQNMHLPYIVQPPSYETEVVIEAGGNLHITTSQEHKMSAMLSDEVHVNKLLNNIGQTIASPPQSQELDFKGFTKSPYGKLQREFYPSCPTTATALSFVSVRNVSSTNISTENQKSNFKGVSTQFVKLYDLVVDENSCNAVDIPLSSGEEPNQTSQQEDESGDNGVKYLISLNKTAEKTTPSGLSKPFRLSVELSFNGKIKSLTPQSEDDVDEVKGDIHILPVNQSFVLKKYSNEKSPDLFGDDDDDDDDDCVDNDNDGVNMDERNKYEDLIENVRVFNYEDDNTETLNVTKVEQERDLGTQEDADNVYEKPLKEYVVEETSTNQSLNCDDLSGGAHRLSHEGNRASKKLESQLRRTEANSLFRENCRREKELLKRIRKCLAGIPPPPAVTIPQLDMFSEVNSRKQQILNFNNTNTNTSTGNDAFSNQSTTQDSSSANFASIFKPTHSIDVAKDMGWRQVLGVRQHGFCFNLCKASENNEYLGLSVIERFIGAETASSYCNSPSSAKKRNARIKLLTQSPGNRLSHLAKRRATFSSVQLANQKANNSRGPQIMVDVKNRKNKHRRKKTPKRVTPGSKKKTRKTPSSSARKRLYRCDLIKPGPSREASKRALFQSPAKQLDQHQRPSTQRLVPIIKPEIANRVEKSKRALFSPDNHYNAESSAQYSADASRFNTARQFDSILKRKRSMMEDDTGESSDLPSQSNNLFRGGAKNLTPRALKIKSQSFCVGASSLSSSSTMAASVGASCALGNAAAAINASNLQTNRNSGLSNSSSMLSSGANVPLGGGGNIAKIQRAHSEMVAQTNNLTENQRKKLLWAVSQALQEKKITTKHESFKQYAATLARVVRRIFQEFFQRSSTSNSETLLRLAKRYAHYVITGRSADDIYLQAKATILREKVESSCRLSGYIGPEEYERIKNSQQLNSFSQNSFASESISNLFATDSSQSAAANSHEIVALSSNASAATFKSHLLSQSQSLINDESFATESPSLKRHGIQANVALQNSSSKNNMCGLALRENVDFESDLRRSAQKNFTGKDQRNVSPYANNNNNNHCNNNNNQLARCLSTEASLLHLSTTKVKRQISFDS